MVTFYQVSDSGEMKKVDFSDLGNFALKDECHLDGLSKNTLNFDELLDKGIYTYSDFDGTEKEDGNWPSALTSGYVVVMVEDESRAQRGITQMVLDDNSGSYYRRGILSETENVFEDWHSLNANNNSTTNLSLGKGSPSAIDGIWTEVSNLSYNIQLWKQINGISTMSTTSETNVILNGIETLALTGAQTIYVRDSTGAFSKLCLDISNGGTGATTAAGALSALGAASQTDLNSLRDSVNKMGYIAYIRAGTTHKVNIYYESYVSLHTSGFLFLDSNGNVPNAVLLAKSYNYPTVQDTVYFIVKDTAIPISISRLNTSQYTGWTISNVANYSSGFFISSYPFSISYN